LTHKQYAERALIRVLIVLAVVTAAMVVSGCGRGGSRFDTGPVLSLTDGVNSLEVWREAGFEVDGEVPAGALPEVSAELGGAGFEEIAESLGWRTREDYPLDTDPSALVGGRIRIHILEYPATLRSEGKDSHTAFQRMMIRACYETLLKVNTSDLKYQPWLATHWKSVPLEDGRQEIYFRINPEARWQTGQRVTAGDVTASWRLKVDEGLLRLGDAIIFREFAEPEALSPYVVRTVSDKQSWRQMMTFATEMRIYPARIIGDLTGKQYMERFQNAPLPGSGRYVILEQEVRQGNSLTLSRINDYWDRENPRKRGEWNFAKIKFVVVPEENLAREKVKKGELDLYQVSQAKYWVREMTPERVSQIERGWLLKEKIFNDQPNGMQGFVFNTRERPFNDLRVRRAFAYLVDRGRMIDKLFFDQYLHQDSFYPGGPYENLDNEKVRYDPELARRLLAEAGWAKTDDQGILINEAGERFIIDLMIPDNPSSERVLTVVQESVLKGGIKLNLKPTTFATRVQMLNDRRFKLYYGAWTGSNFPDPLSSWHSKFAIGPDTGNHPGLIDPEVDSLVTRYDLCFDQEERARLLQAIDRRLTASHVLALAWYGPYDRLISWNKFGKPPWILPRTEDYRDLVRLWWYDPDKHARLREAIDRGEALKRLPVDIHFWNHRDS